MPESALAERAAAGPSLIDRELSAVKTLEQLAAERARAESETELGYLKRRESMERSFREAAEKLIGTYKAENAALQARYKSVKDGIVQQFTVDHAKTDSEYNEARRRANAKAQTLKKAAKKAHEETRWQVLAVYEANKDGTLKRNRELESDIAASAELLETLQHDAAPLLSLCRSLVPADAPHAAAEAAVAEAAAAEPAAEPDDLVAAFQETVRRAEERLEPLLSMRLPKFLSPGQFVWPFVLVLLVAVPAAGFGLGWVVGPIVSGVATIAVAVGIWFMLRGKLRGQVAELYPPLRKELDEAARLEPLAREWAKVRLEKTKADIEARRERDIKAAEEKQQKANTEADAQRELDLKAADEKYPALLKEIEQRRDEALRQADEKYPRRLAELKDKFEADQKALQEAYAQQKDAAKRLYQETWDKIIAAWRDGLAAVGAGVDQVLDENGRLFLDWHHADVSQWQTPKVAPPALRFGQFEVDLAQLPNGLSKDERLTPYGPTKVTLPAILPFPVLGSVLIKASDAGRGPAVELLQAVMLRYLTSIPPGKVRFTIIDPVGLGENFAAYMHLGDYHELLVNSKIWTETPHIEQRLADLSAHMENVIQKYLRNEFNTIEEYNESAGEVAEPFRVLVVANFPSNFSEQAARRLVNIASSGARCGVYTLISVDMKQQLPTGVQLKDLEPHCINFQWKEGRLQWRDPEFSRFPLQLDAPPDPEQVTKIMHVVGQKARDANRVEVPFEFIAPKPDEFWTQDSRGGVDVPLGRAGATKLQHLKLGKGTSQHVLIAGKTGSGKSTLLHALIVNAALRYSPDELELYLIDFKKGVEFKVYAAYELPHARVIAVESEREFGLSVLQRLDAELKYRGDLFRDLGVQDLKSYRELGDQKPLPRILFVVDEFQEFFVEDDKIAHEVSLLLDRLVRQGRAFGVHVHLGSQTLGGAYSLARSTLGQMAVRIALQCSEADAHLILSEDNSAARLLTRPGEAIYNDQNGMVEGNNFFQVVWLSDEKRERYLERLSEMYKALGRPPVPQIVFEGNLPAIPEKNPLLAELLEAPDWPAEALPTTHAWLGEAIAIKDPTDAFFRSQSGNNVLIVGQTDYGAIGIFWMSIIGLAAQHNPNLPAGSARFYLFDGTPADSPNAGILQKAAAVLPHPVRNVGWRELGTTMAELAAEVERRQKVDSGETGTVYLFIYDLQRFRDLRKQEDDYGFSRSGDNKPVHPSKSFATILRDGPPVGIHTIVWCDSLNNLNRTFDRQGLREFEIRVLFQMSANDSSSLIDSPAGSKLGNARGLYFCEEEGRLEKFRPYGLPTDEYLAYVRGRFRSRPLPLAADWSSADGASQPADGLAPAENGHPAPAAVPVDGNGNGNGNGNGHADGDGPVAEPAQPGGWLDEAS